jgi:hypothetical protein
VRSGRRFVLLMISEFLMSNTISPEVTVKTLHRPLSGLAIAAVLLFAACGDDETAPPAEDHTPVSYTVFIDDIQATAPYTFIQGQTVRVRLKFLNQASEDLDDIEADHFAGFTLDPASLATVTRVTDHNYEFDVTGGTPGTGTVTVGFGHDELADEHTFTPVDVFVDPSDGGGAP